MSILNESKVVVKLAIVLWLQAFVVLIIPAARANMQDDALERQLKRIETITSDMRQLWMDDVPLREYHSREAMILLFDAEQPDMDWLGYDPLIQFYLAFDLIDPTVDLYAITAQMNGENVGGYFDLDTSTINLVLSQGDDPGSALDYREEMMYVHEYTHALQDANFNVLDLFHVAYHQPEGDVALRSLIEGDAMFTQHLYMNAALGVHPDTQSILQMTLLDANTLSSLPVPPVILSELYLPYLDGMNFVKALYQVDGWETVNAAYDNPPVSTEHILHPDRYLAGDMPIEVEIAPMPDILRGEWTLVTTGTLGEFYLRQYLSTQLDRMAVDQAATGWGGDRYRLFYNVDTDQRAWVLVSVWDTPTDQAEFSAAYAAFMTERTNRQPISYDGADCWRAVDGVYCLHQTDSLIVGYAPSLKEAIALVNFQVQ